MESAPRKPSTQQDEGIALPDGGTPMSGSSHARLFDPAAGNLEVAGGREILVTHRDRAGVAVYGPYRELDAGRYVAEFRIAGDPRESTYADTIRGWAEVTTDCGDTVLARTVLYASRLADGEVLVGLPFAVERRTAVELRVVSSGRGRLRIALDRNLRELRPAERTFAPVLAPGDTTDDAFFAANFDRFRTIHEQGFDVTLSDQGALVTARGVRFYVRNQEDFQLIHEIFHANEYNLVSTRPKLVVDVGMNIGLVSLLMASDPAVLEVHGFEPFSTPFARALENFSLNPDLERKITPNAFGLADHDAEVDVATDQSATINASIRGAGHGSPETIKVRDAGTTLRTLFRRAEDLGADVYLKVDCEGSEFAIFDSLERSGDFKLIRGVLVEWHKWWSNDDTLDHLFAPLLANDFVIFDRTNSSDMWAGQFNAVRITG